MKTTSIAVVLLVACSSKARETNDDWSAIPLDTTVTTNVGDVMFDLKLPKAWKVDDTPGVKVWHGNLVDRPLDGDADVRIALQPVPPNNLDDFVASVLPGDDYVVDHKQHDRDYFIASAHKKDNSRLLVELVRSKRDTSLACHATVSAIGSVTNAQATLGWLEKLCQTLVVK